MAKLQFFHETSSCQFEGTLEPLFWVWSHLILEFYFSTSQFWRNLRTFILGHISFLNSIFPQAMCNVFLLHHKYIIKNGHNKITLVRFQDLSHFCSMEISVSVDYFWPNKRWCYIVMLHFKIPFLFLYRECKNSIFLFDCLHRRFRDGRNLLGDGVLGIFLIWGGYVTILYVISYSGKVWRGIFYPITYSRKGREFSFPLHFSIFLF